MPKTGKVTTILTSSSLAGAGSTDLSACAAINCEVVEDLALTVRCTYHASATKGCTVYLYSSPDGTNWDTGSLTSFSNDFATGTTCQQTALITPHVMYLKVRVTNDDTIRALTNLTVKATIREESIEQ